MDRGYVNFYRERKFKDLDRQPSCRDEQKQFFREKKNTDMNAIKHAI